MIKYQEKVSLFELGRIVTTRGVACRMEEDDGFIEFLKQSISRHSRGDWGDLCAEDKEENELSLKSGFRLFSAYEQGSLLKIWIITEADRSATTVLFPSEY
jgi:hypothetical protein